MITHLTSALSMFAIASEAPHVVAEMKAGRIAPEMAISGGQSNKVHQAGSIAKYVCTLAALRLENEGRLSLDASIAELLPEYNGPNASDVTLRRLLENRSGLEDRLIPALRNDPSLPSKKLSLIDAANEIGVGEATKAPGVMFEYTNGNWVLVGAILEHVGEQPLSNLLDAWVLKPAGADTAYIIDGELTGDDPVIAKGTSLPLPSFVACAGGLAGTPTDLLKISRYAFRSSDFDFDDRAALRSVTTSAQDYTLGGRFKLVRDANTGQKRRISWQSGNNGAWYAFVAYDPDTDNGFALVTPDADAAEYTLEMRYTWLDEQGLVPFQ
ncbi:serine hydrolase domain-containing protein [Hyphomonas sp. FCG-A18]|uniref:serine hydrolase domain-containing protein n=1 Tax=Hyphomonas sp. FCG-A18 TaxID=3080019 RepID=UPI002B2C2C93|nr:serine hydrolase domain-containing protein [Hyphomonas sp. FCG-A18]